MGLEGAVLKDNLGPHIDKEAPQLNWFKKEMIAAPKLMIVVYVIQIIYYYWIKYKAEFCRISPKLWYHICGTMSDPSGYFFCTCHLD